MMHKLANIMKMQAQLGGSGVVARIGLVHGYNPNDYCAKVRIQPEDVLTGWMPISTQWLGNGWGMFSPPNDGDMVLFICTEGDPESGVIVARLYNDSDRPLSIQPGEFWLVHQTGSLLKFHNDGSVEIASNGNMTATVGGALTANVTGKATINASEVDLVGAGGTAKGIVQADCVCAFTGQPHAQISATVKGSI